MVRKKQKTKTKIKLFKYRKTKIMNKILKEITDLINTTQSKELVVKQGNYKVVKIGDEILHYYYSSIICFANKKYLPIVDKNVLKRDFLFVIMCL